MIQRIQTVYLLLITIVSAALFFIPLFEMPAMGGEGTIRQYYLADNSFLLILNSAIGGFAFISIFLYKKRKVQIRACRMCLMFIIVLVGLLFFTSDTLGSGIEQRVSFKAGTYLPLIQIVFVLLAQRAISKDEELVKSADRLR